MVYVQKDYYVALCPIRRAMCMQWPGCCVAASLQGWLQDYYSIPVSLLDSLYPILGQKELVPTGVKA